MAENKKSFILYCDVINTVNKLDDKTAGELFKHLLKYVNDENPKTENLLIDVAFEPIKQQLKRDLSKYQQIKQKRSDAGKKSAQLRKVKSVPTNSTSVESVQQTSTNPTVTVNDTVTVTVNDIKDNICNTPLDAVTQNQTDQEFLRFCNFIEKLERVKEIKEQITFDNFKSLKSKYDKELIGDKLEELNNWLLDPNIPNAKKKKKSVYHLMVNTWLKNKY